MGTPFSWQHPNGVHPFLCGPSIFGSSSAFLGTRLATCKPSSILCLPNSPWAWGVHILSHYDCWASLLTLVWVFVWFSRMPSYSPQSNNHLKTGFQHFCLYTSLFSPLFPIVSSLTGCLISFPPTTKPQDNLSPHIPNCFCFLAVPWYFPEILY